MLETIRSSLLLLTATSLLGAPLVCFPIEVDAKAELPIAEGSEQPTCARSALPAAVMDVLARSGDAQCHMELLRRTGMAGEEGWSDLVDRLEHAVLAAAAEPESADAEVRARRALRFGVAMPLFQEWLMDRGDAAKREAAGRACYVHLSRALAGDDARLRRNLLATFGAFLDCKTHEQLVAEARRKFGGA